MIYIRTDMNNTIATGHVMRCLSIADAAKNAGEDTTFLLADEQAVGLIEKHGYHTIVLHTKWNDMEQELPILDTLIQTYQIKNMLIDSYQVTKTYLSRLSAQTKIFYIDDRNAFSYPVHALICYANYYEKFDYPSHYANTELYLGPQYAPLRTEFAFCNSKSIKPKAETLLLMSGGSDSYDVLPQLLENLSPEAFKHIDVICGIYHSRYDELKKKYAPHKSIHIQKAVSNIADYMKQADLAVSAGGTILYELCAVGTPAISYIIADNQWDNVVSFQNQNMIDYAGDMRENPAGTIQTILQKISEYKENFVLRTKRSQKMQSLVDGRGAFRIARIFTGSGASSTAENK